MNFQANLLTVEQSNHDKIYTAIEEILSEIQIVPRQSCIPIMFGDNWPIILQGHCFPTECYTKFQWHNGLSLLFE